MTKETGGPAFPRAIDATAVSRGDGGGANYKIRTEQGMTLLDYFAAKAMQSFLSHLVEQGWDAEDLKLVAETSYRLADSMLKAREQ